ncbi:MAG: chemotaxis protein CheW [Planctomycetota bacterium]
MTELHDSLLAAHDTTADDDDRAGQYLTFYLAGEIYGVDILKVQEIRSWDPVTPIPNTGEALLGVLNLRGTIIPIVDLRQYFDLDPGSIDSTTVVVVLRVASGGVTRIMGVLVDGVSDVHHLVSDDLRNAPVVGGLADGSVVALADVGDRVITLLDSDLLLGRGDTATTEGAG